MELGAEYKSKYDEETTNNCQSDNQIIIIISENPDTQSNDNVLLWKVLIYIPQLLQRIQIHSQMTMYYFEGYLLTYHDYFRESRYTVKVQIIIMKHI